MRVNLSAGASFEDLIGRRLLRDNHLVWAPGPFAVAFARGDWLLLDELNLAPDDVLQCIEGGWRNTKAGPAHAGGWM